ncbi:hypothetical protein CH063_16041 [Colletotrichum higginsianum]|uniref:Uncharacterized protein n=1 Tax=Colletotrichum higginsianum (strain IMI 349063) TaxID=759273 RepID=H1W5N9_COLHI|nr:hypothetical protein CH063_16041 [Colletotrichum higginsianum]
MLTMSKLKGGGGDDDDRDDEGKKEISGLAALACLRLPATQRNDSEATKDLGWKEEPRYGFGTDGRTRQGPRWVQRRCCSLYSLAFTALCLLFLLGVGWAYSLTRSQ